MHNYPVYPGNWKLEISSIVPPSLSIEFNLDGRSSSGRVIGWIFYSWKERKEESI